MSIYTELSKASVNQIIQHYAIGLLEEYSPLSGGAANTNYLLQTKTGTYVLTVCDHKSVEEVEMLANLLVYLDLKGFRTTKIIFGTTGQKVCLFDHKAILLKTFIHGETSRSLSSQVLFELGVTIGQLHQINAPEWLPNSFSYGQQCFYELTDSESDHPFIDWLRDKHRYIKKYLHPDLPRSLIHGDIFYSNVVITQNERPVIIDFEEACFYFRVFDLGMVIIGLCSEKGKINFQKVKNILQGYQQEIQLTELEKRVLQPFIIYAATATAFWRYRQFNILYPSPHLKNSFEEMKGIADFVMQTNKEEILEVV